jgi:hypothetical protein
MASGIAPRTREQEHATNNNAAIKSQLKEYPTAIYDNITTKYSVYFPQRQQWRANTQ